LILAVHVLLIREFIHTYKADFIELQKLYLEFHTQMQSICGQLVVSFLNSFLDTPYFLAKMKKNKS